jgi:hydroxymethylbilane synthase
VTGNTVSLRACVAKPDGSVLLQASGAGPVEQAEQLGEQLAAQLRAQGAQEILTHCNSATA